MFSSSDRSFGQDTLKLRAAFVPDGGAVSQLALIAAIGHDQVRIPAVLCLMVGRSQVIRTNISAGRNSIQTQMARSGRRQQPRVTRYHLGMTLGLMAAAI
jgi:hypothetical protein